MLELKDYYKNMSESNSQKEIVLYSSWQLVQDIYELLKPYRARFWLASFIRMLGDLAWLYPAFALASLVTFFINYKQGDSLHTIWIILGLWLLAIIIRCLSQFFSKKIGFEVAEKLEIDSTLKTVQHLFQLDMAWHEQENSGNKIKRIQNAAGEFNNIVKFWLTNIIEIGINLIAINIIIAQFDFVILLVLLVFLITHFLISRFMKQEIERASYTVNIRDEEVNGLLFETINNIRTVKVMAMVQTLYTALVKNSEELFQRIKIKIFWVQSRNSFLLFWTNIFRIGIIMFIIRGIVNGQYEIGFLILFMGYFSNLSSSIDELFNTFVDFSIAKIRIARVKDILKEPIKIENENGKTILPPHWQKISVKNLSFAYGENKVLDDISFEIQRGQKIGIVGLSGVGKSTLFKLLLKEREEFDGDIFFDDISIKHIRSNNYFKQVSVVLQDTEVFNFSLKDNITITNNEQKENQKLLVQALNTAHINELVDKLPLGLDTLIGEKGVKLSGGERQRLGIARAIFKQPELLLLDEATSHLDLESEEKIRDSLHDFFKTITAIVIAHRLTTIREMDKILVIEDGKIIESGSFQELINQQGRFFELWEKQKL